MSSPVNQAALQVVYNPDDKQMVVQWTASARPEDFMNNYLAMLEEGMKHERCRFWLIDLSNQPWPHNENWKWLNDNFAHHAARLLGHPLFLAFVIAPAHRPAIDAEATAAALRMSAEHDCYPCFFDTSTEARA